MRLFPGSVPRLQILHCAVRTVFTDLRRFTLGVGSGSVGTKATGLFTLRPDFVRVGSGVYDEEMSESSCTSSICHSIEQKSDAETHVAVHAIRPLPLPTPRSTPPAPPSPPRPLR